MKTSLQAGHLADRETAAEIIERETMAKVFKNKDKERQVKWVKRGVEEERRQ